MTAKKAGKKNQPQQSQKARSQQTESQCRWPNERVSLTWTGILFVLHSLGLASLFVPLSGLFNNQPIIEQDWGLHFHHLKSMEAFWHQDRALWGYNPFFMAGYPSN